MRIENMVVYNFENAVRASKFPMAVDTNKCEGNMTNTTKMLAGCEMGTGHDQFLTGITVVMDLTCSNKMWVEAERYRFLYFVSSQSTMHRIAKFDIKKCCNEYVSPVVIEEVERLKKIYEEDPTPENYLKLLYNVPSGFELTAQVTTNYRQLKTIYNQRKNHRLNEWREFCEYIRRELPYFEELCLN